VSASLKNESKPQTALANNSRLVCPSSTYTFLVSSLSSPVLASLAQVKPKERERETEREKEKEREVVLGHLPRAARFVMVEWRIIVTPESGAPPANTNDRYSAGDIFYPRPSHYHPSRCFLAETWRKSSGVAGSRDEKRYRTFAKLPFSLQTVIS